MRNIYRTLSYITMPLFLVGIIAGTFILYQFPERLAHGIGIINENQIRQIRQEMGFLNITLAVIVILALIACFMFLFALQKELLLHQQALQIDSEIKQDIKLGTQTEVSEKDILGQRLALIKDNIKEDFSTELQKWERILTLLCQITEASQAAYYELKETDKKQILQFKAGYAFYLPESNVIEYEIGEGLVGQAAKENKFIKISTVPAGYITILSGLGSASPAHLALIPVKTESSKLKGMIEIASFKEFTKTDEEYFKASASLIGG